jgi:hypothetical protein
MERNMGTIDRSIRAFIVAPAAGALALVAGVGSAIGLAALIVAGVMLVTAVAGFCPLYRLFGITTCRRTPETAR